MSALAVLLIAVGIGDVCRRLADNRWVAPVVAVATVVACALLGGLWHAGDVVLLVGAAAAGVAWLLLCDRVERTGQRHVTPLVVLGGAAVALILSSGLGSDVHGAIARWLTWAGQPVDTDANRLLMVVGVMLAQLATGNELVRLVLGSVGAVRPAGQPQASDQLKGGRLLGPMERVLIVGLGLAGQLTMASAVVAAKSIIRFPEISANRGDKGDSTRVGIDDVTEYFLVGSFASWIVAFGGLALVH
ncbi:hypothetical protein [Mycolicibacterium sp. 050158]|uniref:hypothetical protein n=1 Tax=Mycolicibacterium sp. 050158 TaxID=3090602 RepID=UPI00299E26E3|nr:hypothetical protein [Mycolicibacterium sp. 050158]MDX1889928.1 hypothetical protein [Mycolicibacterium sp. 050158]